MQVCFNSGTALAKLGRFYAASLWNQSSIWVSIGPAYNGAIPFSKQQPAVACMIIINVGHTIRFNRKEAKLTVKVVLLSEPLLAGKVMIIDDVDYAGTAIREVMAIIQQVWWRLSLWCAYCLDRQERGPRFELSAIQEGSNATSVSSH